MNVAVDQLTASTSNGNGLRGQSSIQWVAPAPLWAGDARPGTATFRQPSLVKFTSDNFLPEFLDAMEGRAQGIRPADFLAAEEHRFDAAEDRVSGTLKLYHPAHGRFALATGSLVCRQLGLPDRAVSRKDGERVSFVIRREVMVDGKAQEQGWVDDGPRAGGSR